jgi:hypothetical protein
VIPASKKGTVYHHAMRLHVLLLLLLLLLLCCRMYRVVCQCRSKAWVGRTCRCLACRLIWSKHAQN